MPAFVARLIAFAALSAIAAPPAFAQSASQDATIDADGDSLTAGVAAVYLPTYEGSRDYRLLPAPGAIGQYKGFSFQLAGNRLSVDVIPDRAPSGWNIQAGPVGVVNFNRTSIEKIDDARVRALGELGTAIELGGYAGVAKTGVITSAYDRLSISLSYRHDVSGVHRSGILQPSISYVTPLSRKAAAGLFASAERAEAGYAQTYFSVTPAQSVASGLPAFTARGGWKSYTIGALGTIALTGDLLHGVKLVAGGAYSRMLNDFGASPVVALAGDRNQWLGAVGLAYTF